MLPFVVDTHRATHRNHEIDLPGIRQLGRLKKTRVARIGIPAGQPALHASDSLKGDMLQDVNIHPEPAPNRKPIKQSASRR